MRQVSHDITIADLLAGKRRTLAKVITLIESRLAGDRKTANDLLAQLMPHTGKSLRLGISGAPGVGKSSFIEALGKTLLQTGHKLAVLAIDPSSPVSGGSILGDRTRMEELSSHAQAFIRPSPSSGALGGVARYTRETILACEAAGYDIIIIETVGVGQSEILAASMVDCFLILQLPNAGDELQGIKKGILELADLIAITKSDGIFKTAAQQAKAQLEQALMFTRSTQEMPGIHLCSALEGDGIDTIWASIKSLIDKARAQGGFVQRRQEQALQWYHEEINEQLREAMRSHPALTHSMDSYAKDVLQAKLPASVAATRFVELALQKILRV